MVLGRWEYGEFVGRLKTFEEEAETLAEIKNRFQMVSINPFLDMEEARFIILIFVC